MGQTLRGRQQCVAAQLEKLRLELVARGRQFIQVRFELRNAPRLGLEHLLRFRVMSSLAVSGFVCSHHASDITIGRM
jgi:hypothetical protein